MPETNRPIFGKFPLIFKRIRRILFAEHLLALAPKRRRLAGASKCSACIAYF